VLFKVNENEQATQIIPWSISKYNVTTVITCSEFSAAKTILQQSKFQSKELSKLGKINFIELHNCTSS